MGRAVRQLTKLVEYDNELGELLAQATDVEELLNDFNRDLSQYLSGLDNNEEELYEITKDWI